MNLRTRLILILLAVGIVPAVAITLQITNYMQDMATERGQEALEQIGKASIHDQALTTAKQLQSYLRLHPEIDLYDTAALEANEELKALAIQPVGKTGYTAVFDNKAITHFHTDPAMVGRDMSTLASNRPKFWAIFAASLDGSTSDGDYDWPEADGSVRQKYMAVVPVEGTPLRVAATTYLEEFDQPARLLAAELKQVTDLARGRLLVSIVILGFAVLAVAVVVGVRFTTPLKQLATAASQVAEGNWDAVRPTQRRDEIGQLNQAIATMTRQVRELVQNLEQEVTARTGELARRNRYLDIIAGVNEAAASVRNVNALLDEIVRLSADKLDAYHVGIFMLDEDGKQVVLQAASSKRGRRMLAQGHRLPVGGPGLVSQVAAGGQTRIAHTREDLGHAELADTQSEVALALKIQGRITGVMDAQSKEANAFGEQDLALLQALADQVALAISNAQLLRQTQERLEAEQRAYGELTRQGWQSLLVTQTEPGFVKNKGGLLDASELWRPRMEKAQQTGEMSAFEEDDRAVAVPIKVRGQTIGVLDLCKDIQSGAWTSEELTLVETLGEQLGVALESARLYQDTRRRAARERMINEIVGRVRASATVDGILQRTAEELGRAFGASRTWLRLESARGDDSEQPSDTDTEGEK
ncbi:MAG: GAF domain-containing protein [Thermoflexales bacterium]|nr:GAF domain-containing protein [Thermoflexales bacterium]